MNASLLQKVQAFLDLVESKHQSCRSLAKKQREAEGYDLWTLTIGMEYSSITDQSSAATRPAEKSNWDELLADARWAANELQASLMADLTTTEVSLQDRDVSSASEKIEGILQSSGADEIWISCEDQVAHVSGSRTACAAARRSLIQELPPVPKVNFSMQVPTPVELAPIKVPEVAEPKTTSESNGYRPVPSFEFGARTEESDASSFFASMKGWSPANPFDESSNLVSEETSDLFPSSPVGSQFLRPLDVPLPPPPSDEFPPPPPAGPPPSPSSVVAPPPPPPPPPPPIVSPVSLPQETTDSVDDTASHPSLPELVAASSVSSEESYSQDEEFGDESGNNPSPVHQHPPSPPKIKKSRVSNWWS